MSVKKGGGRREENDDLMVYLFISRKTLLGSVGGGPERGRR